MYVSVENKIFFQITGVKKKTMKSIVQMLDIFGLNEMLSYWVSKAEKSVQKKCQYVDNDMTFIDKVLPVASAATTSVLSLLFFPITHMLYTADHMAPSGSYGGNIDTLQERKNQQYTGRSTKIVSYLFKKLWIFSNWNEFV